MPTKLMLMAALLALFISGCATTPRYRGVAQRDATEYVLGLTVDETQRVVEVAPDSAGQRAGVEVGDVLVSLTWILSEAPETLPNAQGDTPTELYTVTVTPLRPPAGVEYKTFRFTEPESIDTLISYGVPLRLELLRQDQVRTLTIIPQPHTMPANATPVQPPLRAF
jgi:hypothetical protein